MSFNAFRENKMLPKITGYTVLLFANFLERSYMGLIERKPVFVVSDKVRFKPAFSAAETNLKIEISLVASLDMILSNKPITKLLIRLGRCSGWTASVFFRNPEDRFSCA